MHIDTVVGMITSVEGLYYTYREPCRVSVPSSELGPPPPDLSPPPRNQGGGNTRLRVRGRGSQFWRLERKPGTLSPLCIPVITNIYKLGYNLGDLNASKSVYLVFLAINARNKPFPQYLELNCSGFLSCDCVMWLCSLLMHISVESVG